MIRRRQASISPYGGITSDKRSSIEVTEYKGRARRRNKSTSAKDYLLLLLFFSLVGFGIKCCLKSRSQVQRTQSPNKIGIQSISARDDCGCFPHDGSGARIAYLISLHNERTLEEALHLMKSISAPGNTILIHIDRKLPFEEYVKSELREFIEGKCQACLAKVMVESKFDIKWGQWSMNDPTHWSMKELSSNPKFIDQWDVYMNLSADTTPVYTPQVLSNLFDPNVQTKDGRGALHNMNFVTSHSCVTGLVPTNIEKFPSFWHKRSHYESDGDFRISYVDDDDNEKTERIVIHFGSQWMALMPDFVHYIATSLEKEKGLANQLKKELIRRGRLMSDETFIPTLLSHHPNFSETIPKLEDGSITLGSFGIMKSIRYERMDENLPDAFGNFNPDQRYDVPKSLVTEIDIPRDWGPYYLGSYDLASIKESGALFARKVSRRIDANLHNILPVSHNEDIPSIQWPDEVLLTKKIDWEKFLEFARRKHLEEKVDL